MSMALLLDAKWTQRGRIISDGLREHFSSSLKHLPHICFSNETYLGWNRKNHYYMMLRWASEFYRSSLSPQAMFFSNHYFPPWINPLRIIQGSTWSFLWSKEDIFHFVVWMLSSQFSWRMIAFWLHCHKCLHI